MIHNVNGNLLESDADALVNTVNCVGVMGKGIALQFKIKFPKNFELYKEACSKNEVSVGKMFITGEMLHYLLTRKLSLISQLKRIGNILLNILISPTVWTL